MKHEHGFHPGIQVCKQRVGFVVEGGLPKRLTMLNRIIDEKIGVPAALVGEELLAQQGIIYQKTWRDAKYLKWIHVLETQCPSDVYPKDKQHQTGQHNHTNYLTGVEHLFAGGLAGNHFPQQEHYMSAV